MQTYEVTDRGKIRIAQSVDASCTGLYSPTNGDLTMVMTQEDDPAPQCVFPTWLTRVWQWHDMASTMRFEFGPPETTMKQYSLNGSSGGITTSPDRELLLDATCLRRDLPDGTSESAFRAVAFVVRGW